MPTSLSYRLAHSGQEHTEVATLPQSTPKPFKINTVVFSLFLGAVLAALALLAVYVYERIKHQKLFEE